jgi:hypothetical protein
MKNILAAIENEELIKKINNKNNIKLIYNNLQYREAILEILEKIKNIDFILIDEKIPGEINIEDLIKKIKIINNKIKIIFFLEKENEEKKNKLKKLGIKNIYINNKINLNKIINIIDKDNETNKKHKENDKEINNKKNIKINKYKEINEIDSNAKIKNKIIIITGEPKSGKTTITNLLLINLLKKNKKILIINLNNKIEKNYLILIGKKYFNNKRKNIKIENKENKFNSIEIKINKNLYFIGELNKILKNKKIKDKKEYINYIFENYNKKYDYILVDIGKNNNRLIKQEIVKRAYKKVYVIDKNFLGIKEIQDLIKKNKKEDLIGKKSLHII